MDRKAWKKKKYRRNRCDCRNRKHGNPKVGDGMCRFHGKYREAVEKRKRGKRLCKDYEQDTGP